METCRRCGILALLLAWASPAQAQGPLTTVWFGPPGPEPASADSETETEVAPALACPAPVTLVRRMGGLDEHATVALLDCEGQPRQEARRAIAILMRPRNRLHPPDEAETAGWAASDGSTEYLAADVRLPHPGLLERLQRLSETFPGHALEILSGYRPHSSPRSRHHHARALDLRIEGVSAETVRDMAVELTGTGVGWYPNQSFLHLDVRVSAAYWEHGNGPQPSGSGRP